MRTSQSARRDDGVVSRSDDIVSISNQYGNIHLIRVEQVSRRGLNVAA